MTDRRTLGRYNLVIASADSPARETKGNVGKQSDPRYLYNGRLYTSLGKLLRR
jgi:hypothetical protein